MPVPLLPAEPPQEDGAAHAPFTVHGQPDADDSEVQHDPEQITGHNAKQPHGQHGNHGGEPGIPRRPERRRQEKADRPERNLRDRGDQHDREDVAHNRPGRMKQPNQRLEQRDNEQSHQCKAHRGKAEKQLRQPPGILDIPPPHALPDHGDRRNGQSIGRDLQKAGERGADGIRRDRIGAEADDEDLGEYFSAVEK